MGFFDDVVGKLRRVYDAYEDILDKFARGASGRDRTLDSVVKNIRNVPASDTAKKTELARFFQSEEGQIFSREDRQKAYDDLLGSERNRRTLG